MVRYLISIKLLIEYPLVQLLFGTYSKLQYLSKQIRYIISQFVMICLLQTLVKYLGNIKLISSTRQGRQFPVLQFTCRYFFNIQLFCSYFSYFHQAILSTCGSRYFLVLMVTCRYFFRYFFNTNLVIFIPIWYILSNLTPTGFG